jgi:DNA-binding SARP family transcriptional activator
VAVGVLGPLELRIADHVVPVRGPKQRALVAVLALNGGRPVSSATLIDGMWGDAPPARAEQTLQQHVSVVRKLLAAAAGDGSVLVTQVPGYVLRVDELDVDGFDRDARGGRDLLADRRFGKALRALDHAVARWRGPALSDVRGTPFLDAAAIRLDEQHTLALEMRFEAVLGVGRAREAIPQLEHAIAVHPLRERLRELLMLALYRSGRQADALAAYQHARATLVDELGIEPGHSLRQLEQQVLAQDPALLHEPFDPVVPSSASVPVVGASSRIDEAVGAMQRASLPSRLATVASEAFVGRREEIARWDNAWKAVDAGDRRLLLVGGDAGIGKTALVAAYAARAAASGARVVYGRCDEDLSVPYQPWLDVLTSIVATESDAVIADHTAARGGELLRLVPNLATRADVVLPQGADAEAERFALFGAVTDLVVRSSGSSPLVLVVDDLHWADRPTASLLRHLAQTVGSERVMILCTYRTTDLGAGNPLARLLAELRFEPGVDFVELRGLDDVELLEILDADPTAEIGSEVIALRDAIAAETGGNPFFAREVLRHLAECGAVERIGDQWTVTADFEDVGLPVSVRQVVGQRVERLGPEVERCLRLAAVIGRDFELGVLADIADAEEDDLLNVLDVAVQADLVHNVGFDHYNFSHALVQHVLYEDLTPSRRGRAHRRVAMALEARYGAEPGDRVGELAAHWASAVVPDEIGKAIEYAHRAGLRALEQLAPDEAIRWFTQAIELHGRAGVRDRLGVELLLGLGTAQRQVLDPAHRETLLAVAADAQALGNSDLLVAAALANHLGWASATGRVDADKVAILASALDAVGDDDSPERARLLATLAAELTFDPDLAKRQAVALESLDIARRLDDPATLVAALIGLVSLPDRPESQTLDCADEAIEIAARLDDTSSMAIVAASAITSAISFADRERMDRYLEICVASSERVGQPALIMRAIGVRALAAVIAGDLETAERLATELLPGATEMGFVLIWYGSILITVRAHQGRGAEVRDMIAAIASDPSSGSAGELARAGLLLADLHAGDESAALEGVREQARAGFPARDDQLWLVQATIMTYVCARVGDVEDAEHLLRLIEPFEEMIAASASVCLFSAACCAGMLADLLGHYADADRLFSQALELGTRLAAPFIVATTQLEWARSLDRRDPSDPRVVELLESALSLAGRCGFKQIEHEACTLGAT